MYVKELVNILSKLEATEQIKVLSDSGWEVSWTDVDGIYYSNAAKVIVLTQEVYDDIKELDTCKIYNKDFNVNDFKCIRKNKNREKTHE